MGCERSWEETTRLAYLLPFAGQSLTLDHFFVANAQLLLLLCASLNQDRRSKEERDHDSGALLCLSLSDTNTHKAPQLFDWQVKTHSDSFVNYTTHLQGKHLCYWVNSTKSDIDTDLQSVYRENTAQTSTSQHKAAFPTMTHHRDIWLAGQSSG